MSFGWGRNGGQDRTPVWSRAFLISAIESLGKVYLRYSKQTRLSTGTLFSLAVILSLIVLWASPLSLFGVVFGLVALSLLVLAVRKVIEGSAKLSSTPRTDEAEQASVSQPRRPVDDAESRKREHRQLKDTRLLPSIRGSVLRIISAANRVRSFEADEKDLVDAVKLDPAISAKLLKQASRADIARARYGKDNMTVGYAVQLLGPQRVLNIAIGSALIGEHKQGRCTAFQYDRFWHECVTRATASAQIASDLRSRGISPEVAHTSGLLCQLGRLSFATAYPDEYAKIIRAADTRPQELRSLEFEAFRIDHNELAAEMMFDWGLPDQTWQAVLYQDDQHEKIVTLDSPEGTFAAMLRWSGMVWSILERRETITEELVDDAVRLAERLHVSADRVELLIEKTKEMQPREASLLGLAPLA